MSLSPLNNSALNTEPLNSVASPSSPTINDNIFGEFNTTPFNCIEVDAGYTIDAYVAEDTVALIREKVGVSIAATTVCQFSQDVQLHAAIPAGTCIGFSQDVQCIIASQSLCRISENVIDATANTFFNRNGYTINVTIGNQLLSDELIKAEDMYIIYEESQSNQATLSLRVQNPVDFIDQVWGKTITIDYVSAAGVDRMFTGVVAIPEIDLIQRKVILTCSNNRDELINNNMASIMPTVGRYSYEVQGSVTDVASEMNLRLTTVPKSLDFDGHNTPTITSWFCKDTEDYNLDGSQIYYRQPKIVWQDRTKIKNTSSIKVSYQYTRLYHYQREFLWEFPYDFCTFLEFQYSLPSVQAIEDAITNAQWKTPSPIIFTSVFPPGSCAFGSQLVLWNTTSIGYQGTYSTIFDSLGNVISDPDGNNVYGFHPFTDQTDLSAIFTIGASWTGSTRFSQYIIEDYNLSVISSQSRAQFGEVKESVSYSLKDDFDASSWEKYETITPAPANATMFGNGSYYFNEDTAPEKMTNAILTAIDTAKTNIYSTHRNTYVIAETPIKPYLNLTHTVRFQDSLITAKGKVQKIVHKLPFAEGGKPSTEITIALFRGVGSATTTPTYAPSRPADDITMPDGTVVLGNHYGVTDPSFNGQIGNKLNNAVFGVPPRTNVPEEFRVDTPAIEDTYRKARTLSATNTTYDIDIPNDLLEVILP